MRLLGTAASRLGVGMHPVQRPSRSAGQPGSSGVSWELLHATLGAHQPELHRAMHRGSFRFGRAIDAGRSTTPGSKSERRRTRVTLSSSSIRGYAPYGYPVAGYREHAVWYYQTGCPGSAGAVVAPLKPRLARRVSSHLLPAVPGLRGGRHGLRGVRRSPNRPRRTARPASRGDCASQRRISRGDNPQEQRGRPSSARAFLGCACSLQEPGLDFTSTSLGRRSTGSAAPRSRRPARARTSSEVRPAGPGRS